MGTFAPLPPPPFFFLLCFHRTASSYTRKDTSGPGSTSRDICYCWLIKMAAHEFYTSCQHHLLYWTQRVPHHSPPPPRTLTQPNKITVSTVPPPFTCHKDATTHCFLGRLSCHLLGLDVPYLLVVLLLQLPLTLLVHLLEAV